MKKFVLNTFLFLLFAFVFYIAALFLWDSMAPPILKNNLKYPIGSYGHMNSRLNEAKTISDIDILFLGSSHAYRGFDTRIFSKNGFKTFNLGSSSQTPIQTKVLIERYLKKLNPKIVFYEVFPTTFSIDGVESSLDIIANDKNDFYSMLMAIRTKNIKTYNAFLYGFTSDMFNLKQSYREPIHKDNDTYIQGGFVEKDIGFYKPKPFQKKEIEINSNQLKCFSEIVKELNSRRVEPVLIFAPIPKVNYDSYTNMAYFDSLMSSYSDYYNFNETMQLEDTLHFYDSHHLNQKGVVLFNKQLIDILKKEYRLTGSN